MWETLYDLIIGVIGSGSTYIWGEYTAQILATLGTVFVFALPFIFCVWIFKKILE